MFLIGFISEISIKLTQTKRIDFAIEILKCIDFVDRNISVYTNNLKLIFYIKISIVLSSVKIQRILVMLGF